MKQWTERDYLGAQEKKRRLGITRLTEFFSDDLKSGFGNNHGLKLRRDFYSWLILYYFKLERNEYLNVQDSFFMSITILI